MKTHISLHLTNVLGCGAKNVIYPFLVKFLQKNFFEIDYLYLSEHSDIYELSNLIERKKLFFYKRYLSNIFSRFFEITLFKPKKNSDYFIVLGDIPISRHKNQIIFLHSTLIVQSIKDHNLFLKLKYLILRLLFFCNSQNIKLIIVQTQVMKSLLLTKYPNLNIEVLSPPCLDIYRNNKSPIVKKKYNKRSKLVGFYPASYYHHKKHNYLTAINFHQLPIKKIILSINPENNPNPDSELIECLGNLSNEETLKNYCKSDFVLFLSCSESYGLPLIEAMTLNIPIICPDLPYCWELCLDQAIYFEPSNFSSSISKSIIELKNKLIIGWRPDYSLCLKHISRDWDVYSTNVASKISKLKDLE
jgi:hypothetical protein